MSGYSIKTLHYATQQVRGPQAFFQTGWDVRMDFNYYVFLIRGEGLLALVDCGTETFAPVNELLLPDLGEDGLARTAAGDRPVVELLRQEGLRPEDVDIVALTHFHWDHAGNVELFPNAKFLVSSTGWAEHQRLRLERPEMVADPIFPERAIDYLQKQADRVVLTDDGPTIMPGVEIRHVGGHTTDSAAFVIPTEEGRVVIPGDTIWTYANIERNIPVGAAVDIRQCYDAMAWAREAGDLLLPTHDPAILERHPHGIG